ncbi:IS1595 family transposase ISSpo3 [subsurface metagenome]
MKFTITNFREMFPNDDVCLKTIMHIRYGNIKKCPKCKKETKFHRVKKRTCYECQWCGYQIYPTKGTIFEKTTTPLNLWFYAIYLMTATRSGVSAREIHRQLGVTYKCAWRIAHQIRSLMGNNLHVKFSGNVEIDDTYIGGKGKGKRGRGAEKKTIVLGILERKGDVKGEVVKNMKKDTITPIIKDNIITGARISTDEFSSYRNLKKEGYFHDYVKHSIKEYVKGDCHIQSIEGFWSRLKNSISGTHIWVSKKHLQKYIDEFAFRYNQRGNGNFMFFELLTHLNKPYESIH